MAAGSCDYLVITRVLERREAASGNAHGPGGTGDSSLLPPGHLKGLFGGGLRLAERVLRRRRQSAQTADKIPQKIVDHHLDPDQLHLPEELH